MKLSWLVPLYVLAATISSSGCGDPVQRAQEAQRIFTPQKPILMGAGSRPDEVTLADVNGDGFPDLLAACTGKAGVCVLLGDGKGRFSAVTGSPFSAGTGVNLIARGDFNSDQKVDLAVTSHDSNGVFIMLGDGRGSFALTLSSPFIGYPFGKPHNHGLAVGDMNGDGKDDITMGHQDQGAIAVLLGDGQEKFEPAPRSPFNLGRGFYPHALGDVNGDGKLDAVIPDIMGSAIVVALGDGKGGLRPAQSYRVKPRPFFILLEDLNGDQHLDIAATHDDIHDVDVFLGDGKGDFKPATGSPFNSGRLGWKLVASDLDADGHKDLVVGGAGGFTVFSGDGAGGFVAKPESAYAVDGAAWGISLGDVNRDRKTDVVICDAEKGTITIYLHK